MKRANYILDWVDLGGGVGASTCRRRRFAAVGGGGHVMSACGYLTAGEAVGGAKRERAMRRRRLGRGTTRATTTTSAERVQLIATLDCALQQMRQLLPICIYSNKASVNTTTGRCFGMR